MNEPEYSDQDLIDQGFEIFSLGNDLQIAMEGPIKSLVMSHQYTMLNAALKSYGRALKAKEDPEFLTNPEVCLADVSSIIIYSIAFLEASINLIFDSSLNDLNVLKITDSQRNAFEIVDLAEDKKSIEKLTTLDKYRIMHKIFFLEDAPLGDKIYQNIVLINKLRNIIIHPKVFGFSTDIDRRKMLRENKKLLDDLSSQYTLGNRSNINSDPLVVALTVDCASWALESISQFWNFYRQKFIDAHLLSHDADESTGMFKEFVFIKGDVPKSVGGWIVLISPLR